MDCRRNLCADTWCCTFRDWTRLEVTEIARAKVMSVNPVPMDVDALRFKGKGKGKTKDHKLKSKANKEKGCPQQVPGSLQEVRLCAAQSRS